MVRSDPIGSAAVLAGVEADPTADGLDAAPVGERRTAGAPEDSRGCIDVAPGCNSDWIAAGDQTVVAGRTLGAVVEAGRTAIVGRSRIAGATLKVVGLWVRSAVSLEVRLQGCRPCGLRRTLMGSQVLKRGLVGQTSYGHRCRLRLVSQRAPLTYGP